MLRIKYVIFDKIHYENDFLWCYCTFSPYLYQSYTFATYYLATIIILKTFINDCVNGVM